MSETDRPPIRVVPVECLDERLAQVSLRTPDNAPRDPDGSLRLAGQVVFGLSPRVSPAGRDYEIGFRAAFLHVACKGCSVEFLPSVEMVLQLGAFTQQESEKQTTGKTAKAGAMARFGAGITGIFGKAEASASGEVSHVAGSEVKIAVSQAVKLVARWPNGLQFGHAVTGDPRNRLSYDAALTGVLLDGDWGHLTPLPGVTSFGAAILLLAKASALVVLPKDAVVKEDALAALKQHAAGWIVTDALEAACSRAPAQGYDARSGEIVLAVGGVDVDLAAFAAETAQAALPARAAAPALPPPDATPAAKPASRKGRSKKSNV